MKFVVWTVLCQWKWFCLIFCDAQVVGGTTTHTLAKERPEKNFNIKTTIPDRFGSSEVDKTNTVTCSTFIHC